MKAKSLISGTIYFLILLTALTALEFYTFMPLQKIAVSDLTWIFTAMLTSGAFIGRVLNKASFIHLTIATLFLCLAFSLLHSVLHLLDAFALQMHLPLLPPFQAAVLWLFCAIGIGLAKLLLIKWNSQKARRTMAMNFPTSLILIILGYHSVNYASYIHSGRQARQPSTPALTANADELTTTKVAAELNGRIEPGTNLIWCATFQTAWNEMTDLIGEEIRFTANEPASAARLNRSEITKEYLDADTFLALAGSYTRAFISDANAKAARKFGTNAFAPQELPEENNTDQLAALAYLAANLPFKNAFERTEDGMNFNGTTVESFTIPFSEGSRKQAEKAEQQVSVQYPPEDQSFMVELLTCKTDHHLILAKIEPEATIDTTVRKAIGYADSLPRKSLETNQHLEIPLFNFDITKSYDELINKPLTLNNPKFHNGAIERAEQNIRFQLDERGAVLRSSASFICVFCAASSSNCIFDQPFLLMLRYRDNPMPYFAMWVDNAEILVKAE